MSEWDKEDLYWDKILSRHLHLVSRVKRHRKRLTKLHPSYSSEVSRPENHSTIRKFYVLPSLLHGRVIFNKCQVTASKNKHNIHVRSNENSISRIIKKPMWTIQVQFPEGLQMIMIIRTNHRFYIDELMPSSYHCWLLLQLNPNTRLNESHGLCIVYISTFY